MPSHFPEHFNFYIQRAFDERRQRNPKYSLRAFARDLSVSVQTLSQILKGHLGLSLSNAQSFAEKLNFSEADKRVFLALVQAKHGRTRADSLMGAERLQELKELLEFREIKPLYESDDLPWYLYPP